MCLSIHSSRQIAARLLAAFLLYICALAAGHATTYNWISNTTVNSDWGTAANWSPSGPPPSGANGITINGTYSSAAYPVIYTSASGSTTLSTASTLGSTASDAGYLGINSGTLTFSAGTTYLGNAGIGVLTVNNGGTFGKGTGSFILGNGATGSGTLTVNTGGTVAITGANSAFTIGSAGTGVVQLYGGALNVSNTASENIAIGGSTGTGTFDIRGGTISASGSSAKQNLNVGYTSSGGTGRGTLTGYGTISMLDSASSPTGAVQVGGYVIGDGMAPNGSVSDQTLNFSSYSAFTTDSNVYGTTSYGLYTENQGAVTLQPAALSTTAANLFWGDSHSSANDWAIGNASATNPVVLINSAYLGRTTNSQAVTVGISLLDPARTTTAGQASTLLANATGNPFMNIWQVSVTGGNPLSLTSFDVHYDNGTDPNGAANFGRIIGFYYWDGSSGTWTDLTQNSTIDTVNSLVNFNGAISIPSGSSGYFALATVNATPALSANAFLNSIGVNTHIGQGIDNTTNVSNALTYTGIRNIRDGAQSITKLTTVHSSCGALVDLVSDNITSLETLNTAGALLSAEGPNEPNNFPLTYNGQYSNGTILTSASTGTINNSVYYDTAYHNNATAGESYGPVGFTYGSSTPFVAGETDLGALRNNFSGWAGFKFTVGSTGITVNQLGRWVVSGNTGTHTVKLVQVSNGATLGSVSVNTLGATAGAFDFVALGTSINLSANTAYYILSQETSGGDQFYDGVQDFLPVAQYQSALYQSVHSDANLTGIPVFNSSEAGGSEPNNVGLQYNTIPTPLPTGVLMPAGTAYGDFANTHNYVEGNGMTAPVDNTAWNAENPTFYPVGPYDGLYSEYGVTWNKSFAGYNSMQLPLLPRVTTESGWQTGNSYGPVGFTYGSGSGTAFVTGETLSDTANSYTGWVGYEFTVGNSPITVNQLGRWVVSGNTGTHPVELVQASDGTVLGSVSVNTSGATAGAFDYVNLSSSINLSANTSYYILSQETSGGDKYYSAGTLLTTTSDATINNSEDSTNNTTFTNGGVINEDQQGKLLLNLYLTAAARGWSYTFVYMLFDEHGQGSWGFYQYNQTTAKSSAVYLHNLTTILADTTSFTPGSLNYSVQSEPATVHDLLIEKSSGAFEIAVWDDRPVGEGTDPVTVTLGGTHSTVNVYDPTVGTTPVQTLSNVSSVSVTLSDHPMIIEIP
jgi:hypothetical protein